MLRKQGFNLNRRFTKKMWKLWDSLTPQERSEYEAYYEGRENTLGRYRCGRLMDMVKRLKGSSGTGS